MDNFFTSPIRIDHPTLGHILSLEQPESIDISGFAKLLYQIKHGLKAAPVNRSNFTMQNSKHICVVVEGFLLFALNDRVTSMFDIRIFLDSTQDRCRIQRFRREAEVDPKVPNSQVTVTDSFARWYNQLVWNEYLKRCNLQMKNAEKVFQCHEYENGCYGQLDAYIKHRLTSTI